MTDHLLLRGDSVKLLASLPAGLADCIFTDPPYDGMNSHLSYGSARSANTSSYVWYEPLSAERFPVFVEACDHVSAEQSFMFCMFDNYSLLELGPQLDQKHRPKKEGFRIKSIVVWDKESIGPGYYFRRQHEMVVFATKGNRKMVSKGHADVARARRVRGKAKYPTEKPVALIVHCLEAALGCDSGAVVLDPFGGSGSTAEAAARIGADSIHIDISDVAHERCRTRLLGVGARVHTDLAAWQAARAARTPVAA